MHINLIEGYPLSNPEDIDLLVTKDGNFKYSFVGLLFLSLSNKRKELEKQLYKEIKKQIEFWKSNIGENTPVCIDSHQHTNSIPLVFKTLMRVIKDEGIEIEYLRIPSEPILPYLLTPSLYFKYTVVGLIKQWLLKFLHIFNKRAFKNSNIKSAYFMGVMFSGRVTEEKIKKLLPKYLKLAEKRGKDIEIGSHPGYMENNENLISGCRDSFKKFYFSDWRKKEYDALMNLKLDLRDERRT